MRKSYMMLLTLALTVLGALNVSAVDRRISLEQEMFKAWDGFGADANEVAEPKAIDVTVENPDGNAFACDYNLFKQIGGGTVVYGSTHVYYLWYANLTGTKKMYFEGTPGMQIRVLYNRQAPEDGDTDPHGHTCPETMVTIGDDGTAVLDVAALGLPYFHVNCLKTGWGSPAGIVRKIEIEGTVKNLTGWVEMLNNGDAEESDDVESFPVSKDGVNIKTADFRPEIVLEGENHVFKVVSDQLEPDGNGQWTTWSTQFYLKPNQPLQEGEKWKLTFRAKSDNGAEITTSAQGNPRNWSAGFIDKFNVLEDWKEFSFEGTVTADQAQKDGGLGSIAFDLNNNNNSQAFYFDDLSLMVYKEESSPVSKFTANFGSYAVVLDFGEATNLPALVKAAGGKRVLFPNDCMEVTFDGTKVTKFFSIEGRPDGKLYAFIDVLDAYPDINYKYEEGNGPAPVVEVAFKNPADAACHLKFTEGLWTDKDVPEFAGLAATYKYECTELYSYRMDAPSLVSVDPENGSFNLPMTLSEFKVKFDALADASQLKAKLGSENLTVAPNEGLATEFTLTRTGSGDLKGEYTLTIYDIFPELDFVIEDGGIEEVTLNFGPVEVDPNDVEELIYESDFTTTGNGEGWMVNADSKEGVDQPLQIAASGSGCRLIHGKNSGFAADVIYLAQRNTSTGGVAVYGTVEGKELALEAKQYHLIVQTAMWDDYANKKALKVQLLPKAAVNAETGGVLDESLIVAEEFKETIGEINNNKEYTEFDITASIAEAGNYVIRLVPSKPDGTFGGYSDANAIGKVMVKYIPNTVGGKETALLKKALENAKEYLAGVANDRYAGEALTALQENVARVDAEWETYTAPSKYKENATLLDNLVQAMKDHRAICDSYDANIKVLIDTRRQIEAEEDNGKPNAKHKFVNAPEFAELCALVGKYHGASQWVNVGTDEAPSWQLAYEFDVLKDDAALNTANAELTPAAASYPKLFTVGASKRNTTGYAAMNERIRVGIEALKALDPENYVIATAEAVFGDDDAVAENLKLELKRAVYKKIAGGEKIFEKVTTKEDPDDPEKTIEERTAVSIDMTVFVKNPNIYAMPKTTAVEGWTKIESNDANAAWVGGTAVAWSSWQSDNHGNNTAYAEDCAFHPGWHQKAAVEQEITDLPAGVYTIKALANDNSGSRKYENNYVYAKVSDSPQTYVKLNESDSIDADASFAAYAAFKNDGWDRTFNKELTIIDGKLTLGCVWDAEAQAFFDEVRLYMTAPAEGFNYEEGAATAIETEAASAARINGIQIYDLNGRRLGTAQKGIQIVKKYMNDGTVKVEKVIVK